MRETVHIGESGPKLVDNVSEKGEQQDVEAPIVDLIAPVQVGMHSFGNQRAIQDILKSAQVRPWPRRLRVHIAEE